MTTIANSGAGIIQFLSIPAILALVTGIGTFLKSLWDRHSERRSIAGITRLSEYLEIDSKRAEPLLNSETVALVTYEMNLRLREISGSPPSSSIERVERWRRSNMFLKAFSVPRELRQQQAKESSNLNISTFLLTSIITASASSLYTYLRTPFALKVGGTTIRIRDDLPIYTLRKAGGLSSEQIISLTPEQIETLIGRPETSLSTTPTILAVMYYIIIILALFVLVGIIAKTLARFDRIADAYCREQRDKSTATRTIESPRS